MSMPISRKVIAEILSVADLGGDVKMHERYCFGTRDILTCLGVELPQRAAYVFMTAAALVLGDPAFEEPGTEEGVEYTPSQAHERALEFANRAKTYNLFNGMMLYFPGTYVVD